MSAGAVDLLDRPTAAAERPRDRPAGPQAAADPGGHARHRIGRSSIPAVLAWCAERGHPITTYNPWLSLSLCRCGEIQRAGEAQTTDAAWRAMHEIFHVCDYDAHARICGCYTRSPRRPATPAAP